MRVLSITDQKPIKMKKPGSFHRTAYDKIKDGDGEA